MIAAAIRELDKRTARIASAECDGDSRTLGRLPRTFTARDCFATSQVTLASFRTYGEFTYFNSRQFLAKSYYRIYYYIVRRFFIDSHFAGARIRNSLLSPESLRSEVMIGLDRRFFGCFIFMMVVRFHRHAAPGCLVISLLSLGGQAFLPSSGLGPAQSTLPITTLGVTALRA